MCPCTAPHIGAVKMSSSPIPRAVSLRYNYEAVRVTSHNIHRKE